MDFTGIVNFVNLIVAGGPHAIMAILVILLVGMFLERRRLVAELSRKDAKIESIIDDYYRGNLTLSEALNSLKSVLYEIKGKF